MLLEICIDRFDSARAACDGGADRLEVCGALEAGGVTPSAGLVEACLTLGSVDVMMMIRPHGGGFRYGVDELDVMRRDIELARRLGVRGVVLGALAADHRVDVETSRRLIDAARPLQVTFHRAFDLTPDPFEALETLVELGVERVLTSGQAASAVAGADLIRRLIERAAGRLSVMPGAGLSGANVARLVRMTGAGEVHASASDLRSANEFAALGFVGAERVTTVERVRAIRGALRDGTF